MNRMKDLFWMAVIVLFAAFSSCSDDKNDGTDEGVEAKLLTFGFYAEDNSSILSDDYIATLSSTTAKVTMPAFIDKSALVARFTTNDGNIVLVDGVTQVSGATANDFTAPVDYIVSNGKQNVKYTITVAKSSNMAWVRMPDFTATSVFSGSVLKINPVDQVPYLGFKLKEEEKMAVIKLVDGTTWTAVGSLEGFGGEVSLSNYDFDIDKDGIPYVVYSDNSATTVAGAASLMKWNGTTWNYVGNQGFVNAQSQQLHLRVLDNGETIVSQVNNSNKAGDCIISSWQILPLCLPNFQRRTCLPFCAKEMLRTFIGTTSLPKLFNLPKVIVEEWKLCNGMDTLVSACAYENFI